MDIGCNKGYTSAHFFGLWAPELGFRPNTLQTKRPEILCGTCKDCEEQVRHSCFVAVVLIFVGVLFQSNGGVCEALVWRHWSWSCTGQKRWREWDGRMLVLLAQCIVWHEARACD